MTGRATPYRVMLDSRREFRAGDEGIAHFGDEAWLVKVVRIDADNFCIVELLHRWDGPIPERHPILPLPPNEYPDE